MLPIVVNAEVSIPPEALTFKAVRAGGPGGQNVNKVSSKVEVRVEVERIQGLGQMAQERLLAAIRNQLDADGRWIVRSSKTRDQAKNLEDAREKIRAAVAVALEIPRVRTATRPTRGSQRRRVEGKRLAGAKKAGRRGEWD